MIYVITHKTFPSVVEDREHFKVLHVGKNRSYLPDYQLDTEGDSISSKNANYCELTGLYWIWKNEKMPTEEITGLLHYRRYFTSALEDFLYTYFGRNPKPADFPKFVEILSSYDIILPSAEHIIRTVRESYAEVHHAEDLDLLRCVLGEVWPAYVGAFDDVMNSHNYYYGNMMICRKKTLDAYAAWLFPLLFRLEQLIDLNKYENDYQKRVFGFLSERLLQVWACHEKLKIYELPVYNTEQRRMTVFEKNRSRGRRALQKLTQHMDGGK